MSKLAVVILTYNEEINLQACLDSVAWADELLVLDSGSTDNSRAIAEQNEVRVLVNKMTPFLISEQRNFALSEGGLSADWVLFVDADEVVTPELERRLRQFTATAPKSIVAARLAPKFMFMGRWLRHLQNYPSWHDRVVRLGAARFQGGVWEQFDTTGEIVNIDEPYLHFSLNKGFSHWLEKHDRYSTVEAYDILDSLGYAVDDSPSYVRTGRKRIQRTLSAYLWPVRPLLRFGYTYFLKRGFLDGVPGFVYALMMLVYELMITIKVVELRRRARSLPF